MIEKLRAVLSRMPRGLTIFGGGVLVGLLLGLAIPL